MNSEKNRNKEWLCHQKSLKKEAVLEGAGIHTGQQCTLKLLPAAAGTGVVFVRTDLPNRPRVKAEFANLVPTDRRTALAAGGRSSTHSCSTVPEKGEWEEGEQRPGAARVETVEHLLAVMFVLGVDNCLVEINGPELPALDGSACGYYNLLCDCGVRELGSPRREVIVRAPVEVSSGEAVIRALPAESFSVSYRLSYPHLRLEQEVDFAVEPEAFAREIAPARTFVPEEEIERLRAAGFGKGANEDNTVVLTPDGPRGKLRFADEPARHKVLDLLGDLFFVGGRLIGRIECERSGHALNRELVKTLMEQELT